MLKPRWTWGLMGLQMLSFMGVIFVVEPRRVRLMQGHMQVRGDDTSKRVERAVDASYLV